MIPRLGAEADIFIVGLGIVHVDQVTKEAERCFDQSNEILFVERGFGIEAYLSSKCSKVTDLTKLYVNDGDRQETYRRMSAAVVEAALDHAPVTFALYGHPLVFCYPPFLIREMARYLDLSIKVLPGISAFDCMLTDLFIDPSVNGVQMFEATEMLLRQRPLQPDVPAVLWQIGSLETGLYSAAPSNSRRFSRFKAHLLAYYPTNHIIYAVHCASHPLLKPEVYRFELSEIDQHAAALHAGFTLYIPPLDTVRGFDMELANRLVDLDHLRAITEPDT